MLGQEHRKTSWELKLLCSISVLFAECSLPSLREAPVKCAQGLWLIFLFLRSTPLTWRRSKYFLKILGEFGQKNHLQTWAKNVEYVFHASPNNAAEQSWKSIRSSQGKVSRPDFCRRQFVIINATLAWLSSFISSQRFNWRLMNMSLKHWFYLERELRYV